MRTNFDNLISNNNLEPKPNTDYIYNLDMVWETDTHKSIYVNKGRIVENVEQVDSGSYEFNFKGETERYQCTYGWAFVEDLATNRLILAEIENQREIITKHKGIIESLQCSIKGLFKYSNEINNKAEEK